MNKRKRVAIHKHRKRAKKLEERRKAAGPGTTTAARPAARTEPRAGEARPAADPAARRPRRRTAPGGA